MSRERAHAENGQASAELAAVIPFFLLLVMLLAQIGVVLFDQLAVQQAAREGARAAAVDPSTGAAVAAAERATKLDASRLKVTVASHLDTAAMVTVRVSYESRVNVPFTERVLLRPQVIASATMRRETAG